jgi:amidophosphoribosyltransferase
MKQPSPCIFELIYFARPDSKVWGTASTVYRRGARLAPARARASRSRPTGVQRADSSNSAALGYAEESGIPLELGLIRNHYVGRTFIQPTQEGRDFKVRVKYNADAGGARRQARDRGGRLDRARHDEPLA